MSQEALKNYTLKTINFGNEFLSRLSQIQLPEELSEMQIKLAECFIELNRIWKSVNKLAFRFEGEGGLGDLKLKLKEMEISQTPIPKKLASKSKSIGNLLEGDDMDSKKVISSDNSKLCVSLAPSYTNWSPIIPPKIMKKKVENSISLDFSKSNAKSNKPVDNNEKNYMNFSGSTSLPAQPEERALVKSTGNCSQRFSDSIQRPASENPTSHQESEELDYLQLESERQLPEVKKFSLISKVKDVVVNDWRLGERYCGISDDILYVFYSFQDTHAEISMDIPTIFIGKGFNMEKAVIFQSRDLLVKIYFSNIENQEKFYKATFQAQNKYNLQHCNPTQSLPRNAAPQMPKPYSKKEQPFYLNTNIWSKRISKYRISKMETSNNHSSSCADNGEEEYVEMIPSSSQIKSN